MTAVIQAERLSKSYGPHRGIVDVDLVVNEGEIFGFLGPNGAGKTTTIRILLDLIRPTSGVAKVFGTVASADPVAIHRRLGYLPGEWNLYDRLSGAETIRYFANLRGGVDPAYVGASLPLIVLFAAGRQDPLLTASQEIVAVEVVRALVGSIGIVAAVPLTTAIAVMLTGRRLPFVGEGTGTRRAPGWD